MIYKILNLMLVAFFFSSDSYGALQPSGQQFSEQTQRSNFDHLVFDDKGHLIGTEYGEVIHVEEDSTSNSEEYLVAGAGCYYHSYRYYYVCVKRNWWGTCTQSVLVYGPTRHTCN